MTELHFRKMDFQGEVRYLYLFIHTNYNPGTETIAQSIFLLDPSLLCVRDLKIHMLIAPALYMNLLTVVLHDCQ